MDTSSQLYTTVRNKRHRPTSTSPTIPSKIPTRNRFDPIRNEYIGLPLPTPATSTIPKPTAINPPKTKIPTIKIKSTYSWKVISNILNSGLSLPPVGRLVGNSLYNVACQTIPDFFKAKELLKNSNIEYFTFRAPTEKLHEYVIRGLPTDTDLSELKATLSSLGVDTVNIWQILTTKPLPGEEQSTSVTRTQRKTPLFKISLAADADLDYFLSLTSLFHLKISIAPFRRAKTPPQCYNCQAYGHTKNFCNINPVCVRCGGPHPSNLCQKSATTPAICANCTMAHPASYKGCQAFLKAKQQMKPKPATYAAATKTTPTAAEFPSLPKSNTTSAQPNPTPKTPLHTPSSSETNALFTWFLGVVETLKSLPTTQEKKLFLLKTALDISLQDP